jgi:GntR family transcriptional regulator
MLIVVDPQSGVPVYRQIMDQIRFHVASGMLSPGEELPSTRALSSELGVNPMTISKAYGYLEREGIVERRPGRPLVVSGLEDDDMQQSKLDQLREALAPGATAARQLGIEKDEAVRVLRTLLDEGTEDQEEDR